MVVKTAYKKWIKPDRKILSKDIKEKDFDKIKKSMTDFCEANDLDKPLFLEQHLDGKQKVLDILLPPPLNIDASIEEGQIVIANKLSKDEYKALAHMLHLMGVKDFKFTYYTDEKFAYNLQKTWNDNTGKVKLPEYEKKTADKYLSSSRAAKKQMNVADITIQQNLEKVGKVLEHDCKIRVGLDGSLIVKVYGSNKDMQESGKLTKDGRGEQKWNFYLRVKEENQNGVNTLTCSFQTPGGKPITKEHAEMIAEVYKNSGYTHVTLGNKLVDDDKGILMGAFAKRHITPIMPNVPILYKVYFEALDGEVKKAQMDIGKKLELKERLFNQLKENCRVETGSEMPSSAAMQTHFDVMELEIIKENLSVSGRLKSATKYDGDKISSIIGTIDGSKEFDSAKKMELKKDLLQHIKIANQKKIAAGQDLDPKVEKWVESLDVLIKIDNLYTKQLYPKIEAAINADEPNANEIYSVVKAVAKALSEYKNNISKEDFDANKVFDKEYKESKESFDAKMISYGVEKDDYKMERKIKSLISLASGSLSNSIEKIKYDYSDVKFDSLFVPRITPPSDYKIPDSSRGVVRSSGRGRS